MARLLFPESGSRRADNSAGHPIPGRTYTVYSDSAGTVLADIVQDQNGTPGLAYTGSRITTDSFGYLPTWWGPTTGASRLWLTDGTVDPWPVDAVPGNRIDGLDTRVTAIEQAPPSAPVTSVAGHTGVVTLTAADVAGVETTTGAQAKADTVQAHLDTHAAATTGVHGIADTSLLETQAGAQTRANTARDAAIAASDPAGTAAAAINVHNADTTGVHGIDDTTNLETVTGSQAKADAAAAASIPLVQKGAANGVASLGSDGKLSGAQIPAIPVVNYLGPTANQAAMLALTGVQGDFTTRLDTSTNWVLTGGDPTVLADWTELTYPTAAVTSVAGRTGAVTVTKSDVGLANADNTSDANKPVSTAQQAALDLKAPLASPTFTGTVSGVTKAMVGLGNVLNLAPADLGISTDAQAALDLKTPAARSITTTSPLSGGGDLTVDRVLSVADATSGGKGVIQLAGDLAGSATAPVVANGAITSAKLADATIVDADISGSAAIAQAKISGLTAALGGKVDKGSQVFNIVDYGAVSGGSTSGNATAVNTALAAAVSAGGGVLFVPAGTFDVGANTLALNANKNISIVGAGWQASKLLCSGAFLTAVNSSDQGRVADLYIQCTTSTNTADGISLDYPRRWTVERCYFQGFGGNSVKVGGGLHTWIRNNYFLAKDSSNTNGHAGIYVTRSAANVDPTTIITMANYVGSGKQYGILWEYPALSQSIGDIVEGCSKSMRLHQADVLVQGFYAEANTADGIEIFDSPVAIIGPIRTEPSSVTWLNVAFGDRYIARVGRNYVQAGKGLVFGGGTGGYDVTTNPSLRAGTGSPEGAVTGVVSSLWLRTDGVAGGSLYIKETGTGNTGWTALGAVAVTSSRTISTTLPLTGGGDLSANRTLAVNNATGSAVGVVQLAGDLGGTATAPTVPGKASKTALAYNVADYGAVGDGTTDDTTAVQAALDAIPSGAGLVFPPNKVYLCGGLTITSKTDVVIDGLGATIKWKATGARIGMLIAGTCTNVTVQNLKILGNATLGDAHAGIYCANNSGNTLKNIRILNNRIQDVTLGISFNADSAGVFQDVLVQGNHVENIIGTSSGYGYGIHRANRSGTPDGFRIIGNTIRGAQRHSIYHAMGAGTVIDGNQIHDHRATVGDGSLLSAIMIARSGDLTVTGNVVSGGKDSAITLGAIGTSDGGTIARNYTVTGNFFGNPLDAVPLMVIGTASPAADGNPEGVLVANNAFYATTNAAAIRLYGGKRVRIVHNVYENTATTGTTTGFGFQPQGESSGTATYSDDIVVAGNTLNFASGGTKLPLNLSGAETTGAKITFRDNAITAGSANVFYAPVAVTNPNIVITGQPQTGINYSTGIGPNGLPAQRTRHAVADANYSIAHTDAVVAYTSLTAARIVTLPAVGDANGLVYTIKDESGSCSATLTLTVTPASGTIDGASTVVIATPYGQLNVYSNGSNWFTGRPQAPDIQTFTTPGTATWTKPPGVVTVFSSMVAGGGGGGSGACGDAGTARGGGCGGAGGSYSQITLPAAQLTSTVTVTVGAGGTGGASVSTTATNGNTGGNGGSSSFGSYMRATNNATNGGGGGSASGAAVTGPSNVGGLFAGGGGQGSAASGGAGTASSTIPNGAGGGASGGGITSGNVSGAGAAGRQPISTVSAAGAAGTAPGGSAGATSDAPAGLPVPGAGGSSGAAGDASTAGGAGANGGKYGGGGGGGGASFTGLASGKGGDGAPGMVQAVSYFS